MGLSCSAPLQGTALLQYRLCSALLQYKAAGQALAGKQKAAEGGFGGKKVEILLRALNYNLLYYIIALIMFNKILLRARCTIICSITYMCNYY